MAAPTGLINAPAPGRRRNRSMKSHRKELWFEAPRRRQLINITPTIETELAASGIREDLCLVNAMHISVSDGPTKPKDQRT